MQKYPIVRPCRVNISHAGQKQLIDLTWDETDDFPRAQKSALGGYADNLLPLNVGQDPQYFLQISAFSAVSSTVRVVSDDFMFLFTTKYYTGYIIIVVFTLASAAAFTLWEEFFF